MKEIWVEKYRPKKLEEIVGQVEVQDRLKAYVKEGNLPHLLFAGPPGTGKTTSAIALARELFGETWRENFNELNASDERGIDVVRVKIKEFARTRPLGGAPFKIIFLDEADNLTPDAQAALRRTMERYTNTCRFVLSCNYSSKIIEPIQSRCALFRFRPLRPPEISKYLLRIAKVESVQITEEGMAALQYVAQGDLRRATNALQMATAVSDKVDANILYQTASAARPEAVKKLLEIALEGDFLKAREELDRLLIEYGLSGEDLIRQVHRGVYDLGIADELKIRLIDRIGETEFRLVEGSQERIQLEALLAHFVLVGQESRRKPVSKGSD